MPSANRPSIWARRKSSKLIVALPVALAAVGSGIAGASSGGGVGAPSPPSVSDVTCQSSCAGLREAASGARVKVSGRSLGYVETVRFAEKGGGRVDAKAKNVSGSSVEAIVPERAATGKVKVSDATGQEAVSPKELVIVDAKEIEAPAEGGGISNVSASPAKGYFAGKKRATASFVARGSGPQDVRVDVVNDGGGVVRTMVAKNVEGQTPAQVRWNGKTSSGEVAPNGDYRFNVQPLSGGGGDRAGFEQYNHIFPVRGKHSYGDSLGAGRGHRGQDVFAKCGTPIVAARGGKVQVNAYHGAAGHYVVVDGKDTNIDYVYMHLKKRSKLKVGKRVKTGGRIGLNGETGNASGCHLHFEMWKGDWYGGGKVMNPTKPLKNWDGWS